MVPKLKCVVHIIKNKKNNKMMGMRNKLIAIKKKINLYKTNHVSLV